MPDPRRPFYRQTATIVPPWDPESDVTVELIIMDQTQDLGRQDLPELQEAGWIAHSVKALDVYIRVVG